MIRKMNITTISTLLINILNIDLWIIHETINWNRQDLKAQRRESQKNKGLYKNSKALVKKKRMGR